MNPYLLIVSALWLVFILYWLFSAIGAKRNVSTNWRWMMGLRVLIVIVLIIIFHTQALAPLPYAMTNPTGPAEGLIGSILVALGVGFAIWARTYLGRNWGMPMSVKENPELVTTGPYAYVRHPIYTGVLLNFVGSTLVIGIWWLVLLVILGPYFIFSAMREEKLMMKTFPNQYPEYKKRTKMLIPFVW